MAVRTPGAGLPARPRLLVPILVAVAAAVVVLSVLLSVYTELLWYGSVHFRVVYTTGLRTKLLLFAGFGLVMALVVGANAYAAHRVRPPFRPMSLEQQNLERYRLGVEPYRRAVLLAGSAVFGLFAGLAAAGRWQEYLLWRNATPFGVKDPEFHRDISYFTFVYPFHRFVLGFLLTAVVLALIVAVLVHYLFGGLRLQTAGDKVSPAARVHLSVLVGVFVLLKAAAYYLDRFGLDFSTRGRVQGASYTDVNAVLPAKNILIGVAIICALLFFANIVVRNILLPAGALALLVLSAVVFGGIYPAYTQQFRVKPNEINREAAYISRNIEATRQAYGIQNVTIAPYPAATGTATTAAVKRDAGTLNNTRVLDPTVLPGTFRQFQRLRAYFGFNTKALDIDRYNLGDGLKDYVVAVRELRTAGLDATQRNWINEHLIYTHGNGFVAAPANEAPNGTPNFVEGGLPVTGPLPIDESRIYFGEGTTDYSIVNTRQAETDGPIQGNDAPTYHYSGGGGVQLSPLRRLAYALEFRDKNLLLSSAVNSSSRLLYDRTPLQRIGKVAPFLTLDEDPYPAVVGGRVLWIVDGYTTSAGYPYSQLTSLGSALRDSVTGAAVPQEQISYIRNSVKATVDAFTGQVTLYRVDSAHPDPVLQTWSKAYGGKLLQPEAAVSPQLRAHFRYPEDLFKVQRQLLTQYHITDPRQFFQGTDYWQVPNDPAGNAAGDEGTRPVDPTGQSIFNTSSTVDQPPYYVISQFPGEKAPTFNLTTSFVARQAPNLTAVAAVSSDQGDYGTIRVLQLPDNVQVNGPGQVAGLFQSDAKVRSVLFALNQQGSTRIIPGNLLTLPAAGGLLYVEPIYVQAQQGESYPTLQYVIASFGNKIAIQTTLGGALSDLFTGASAPAPSASGTPSGTPSSSTSSPAGGKPGTLAQAIAAANNAFQQGQDALSRRDLAGYAAAQQRLQRALAQLSAAAAAPRPSPTR